ncbi:MAG: M48 family metalloprotease [Myxococcales bacterium]|nr:M48 family metalloprotease [Myxococcales bacterium]
MKRLLAVATVALLGGCKTMPKNLDDWFALAREGKDLASRLQELEKRKASCDAIEKNEVAWDEERAIGGATAIRWVQQLGGLVVTPPPGAKTDDLPSMDAAALQDDGAKVTAYVNTVGKNLAAQSSRPSLPWTFAVLKDAQPNAYAAPGGIVLVSKGMLAQCENEAQLAGVLAHEIAHVTGRHAIHDYRSKKTRECAGSFIKALGDETGLSSMARARLESTAKAFDGLLSKSTNGFIDFGEKGVNVDALVTLVDEQADAMLTNAYAREAELEADAEAARLMANAGYDVGEYKKLLAKLPRAGVIGKHPPTDERTKFVEDALAKAKTLPTSGGVKPALLRR